MAAGFVGRTRELADLTWLLDQVRHPTSDRPGRAVAIRGRRRVGKSRLITEFIKRGKVPSFYFVAEGGRVEIERQRFIDNIALSDLPKAGDWPPTSAPGSWSDTLAQLTPFIPQDKPSIIVLDEVSYLTGDSDGFEGALQAVWDRHWSALPVLLVLIGSNRSEMERLTSHGRPFYGRAVDTEIKPLLPEDIVQLVKLPAAEALDAYLITGGIPSLVTTWQPGQSVADYLAGNLKTSLSPLIVTGERVLTSEYPIEVQAKQVLRSIGSDAKTFTAIGQHAKIDQPTTLTRSLDQLVERGIVATDEPLSTSTTRLKSYRVADPFMRFWLAFLPDAAQFIDAGRGDVVTARVRKGWTSWRGRAIEPIIRELLWRRALDDDRIPEARRVGSWWNRNGTVEVDLVGADRTAPAHTVAFLGSIKWRETQKFDNHDAAALAATRIAVPGANDATTLLAVSRTGGAASGVTVLTPNDIIA